MPIQMLMPASRRRRNGITPLPIPDYQGVYSCWMFGLSVDPDQFRCTPAEFAAQLASEGIAVDPTGLRDGVLDAIGARYVDTTERSVLDAATADRCDYLVASGSLPLIASGQFDEAERQRHFPNHILGDVGRYLRCFFRPADPDRPVAGDQRQQGPQVRQNGAGPAARAHRFKLRRRICGACVGRLN